MRRLGDSMLLWQAARTVGLAFAALVTVPMNRTLSAAEREAEARNRLAVQETFDAWRKGTGSVFDLLAPDARWTIAGTSLVSGTYTSRQDFLDAVVTPFDARLSGRLVPSVRGIHADGDMVIALFDGEGTARDGRPYTNTYSWHMRMRDGRIVDVVAFFDALEFDDLWTRVEPR